MNWLIEKCEAVRRSTIRRGAVETVSGYAPLALPGSTGERIRMMTVYGRSVQNGTPAPDTPVSVVGVEGKCRSRGKNLFDKAQALTGYYRSADGGLVLNATNFASPYIFAIAGRSYKLSGHGSGSIMFFSANKSTLLGNANPAPVGTAYVCFNGQVASIGTAQLELSPAATPYAPYASPSIITHPTLHGIPLASTATDYTYIDSNGQKYAADTWQWREEGVWEHVQRDFGLTFDGVSSGRYLVGKNADNGDYKSFYIGKMSVPKYMKSGYAGMMCSHFPYAQWIPPVGNYWWESSASVGIRLHKSFMPGYDDLTTDAQRIAAANAWLAANPVTVYYQLANPIITQYTHVPWMHTIDASHAGDPLDVAYLDNVDGTAVMPFITASYYKEVIL